MWHWLRKLFGSVNGIPADVERGWIRLSEAAHLFSPEEPNYAFGDMDDEGKRRLTEFGADCRCEFQFMPTGGACVFSMALGFFSLSAGALNRHRAGHDRASGSVKASSQQWKLSHRQTA